MYAYNKRAAKVEENIKYECKIPIAARLAYILLFSVELKDSFHIACEYIHYCKRLEPYWYRCIKSGSTFQGSILKISREYIFPKFVFPITLPRDPSLVHVKLLVIASKVISIVKQTPRNKTTRNNRCLIRCGVLRLTGICILQASIIPQLLITSTLHISNISLKNSSIHQLIIKCRNK